MNQTYNATTTTELFQQVSQHTAALPIGVYVLFVGFAMLTTYQRRRSFPDALIVSGFVGVVLGGLMWAIQILSWEIAVIGLPLLVFGYVSKAF